MAYDLVTVILGVSWTETILGLTFFFLRFINNLRLIGRFRWDFVLAALAVTTGITAQIFLQISVNAGLGQHIDTIPEAHRIIALKWAWVFQLLAIATSCFGKLAIVMFLVQIRGRHERKPWFLLILGWLILVFNVTVFGTILGQCHPVQKLWDDSLPGSCDPGRKNNQNYSFFQASFNTFSDAALATYPMHLFWKLQMRLRLKVALSLLMGMGWIAAACSGVKTYELQALTTTGDITYALSHLIIWASTEGWIVVIVGCIPPIRPLIERIFQKLGLTKKSSSPLRPSGAYGAFGSNPTGSHSHSQSRIYTKQRVDDMAWTELTRVDSHTGSKEEVIPGPAQVLVTTDIAMEYEGSTMRKESLATRVSLGDDHRV
ncbi:hypothetical protein MW887_005797 [Aspergillus wentii]|nr:hypothetical protein MW887_005797 [Aspergillus wentii]